MNNTICYYLKKMESWLLPYTCLLCKKLTHQQRDLCEACLQTLPAPKKSCLRCACPLNDTFIQPYCDICTKNPPLFDATYALYLYKPPLTQLILELKFKYVLTHARVLGELLANQIQQVWYKEKKLPDIIIPIPLHAARLKERGFNQALEISRPIAKSISRPIQYQVACRIKATAAQATLNAIERRQNMQQAFEITENLVNLHVAVIDDVITTGETVLEFCKTLKQAGVHKIDVWCCARAYHIE